MTGRNFSDIKEGRNDMSFEEKREFKSLAHDFCVPSTAIEQIMASCHTYETARLKMLDLVFGHEKKQKSHREMSGVRFSSLS